MADVIVTFFNIGRCYCHVLADVIAILWLMLLPLFDVGRCYCHSLFIGGTNYATVAVVMPLVGVL